MKKIICLSATLLLFLASLSCNAQNKAYDVFTPISKYLQQGNAEALSAWFSSNLQVSVISQESPVSKTQAKQILKSFFEAYPPRSFTISHTAGRSNMKYALGTLNAGGEQFNVTVFVTYKDSTYLIQQLSIEKGEFRPSDRMIGQ